MSFGGKNRKKERERENEGENVSENVRENVRENERECVCVRACELRTIQTKFLYTLHMCRASGDPILSRCLQRALR